MHIVDLEPFETSDDPVTAVRKVTGEMHKWGQGLPEKPRWLVLNKIDRIDPEELEQRCQQVIDELEWTGPVFKISTVRRDGLSALTYSVMEFLEESRATHTAQPTPLEEDEDDADSL